MLSRAFHDPLRGTLWLQPAWRAVGRRCPRVLDHEQALGLAARLLDDGFNERRLRALYQEACGGPPCFDGLRQSFSERLAAALASGRIRVVLRGERQRAAPGLGGDPSQDDTQEAAEESLADKKKTHFIKFQVTDEDTGKPLPGVTVKLRLPTGELRTLTTDGQGMVKVEGLPEGGSWDLEAIESNDTLEVT